MCRCRASWHNQGAYAPPGGARRARGAPWRSPALGTTIMEACTIVSGAHVACGGSGLCGVQGGPTLVGWGGRLSLIAVRHGAAWRRAPRPSTPALTSTNPWTPAAAPFLDAPADA